MNIIVTNKYKDIIYSTNIEILKEMNGVFKVNQIANAFRSIFYKKIIIDGTAIQDYPKESVLKELASSFDMDKLILFLPPDNPPPKKFLSVLVSLNILNFTDNINGLRKLIVKSNTIDDVREFIEEKSNNIEDNNNNNMEFEKNINTSDKIVLGIDNITSDTYNTDLIYMMKKVLENKYNKKVLSLEVNKNEFKYLNQDDMLSVNDYKFENIIQNDLHYDIILVDLNNSKNSNLCTDVLYLINPSLYEINKLLYNNRNIFLTLKSKKIVLINSLLHENDVNIFAKEANISIYYNLQPTNDRVLNDSIDKLLLKLGVVDDAKPTKKGLFDIFK